MAAYAELVSLMNDLELIPNHPTHSFSFDHKQITSLSQIVHFLIDFMDTYDTHGCTREAAQLLESRIASAALAAHDVIESHVVHQIIAESTLDRNSRPYFLLDLQKTIDNVDFVERKAMQFKAKSGLKAEQPTYSPPASSSEPLMSGKNVMVGFDDVAVRLMEMLTGEPSSKRVIPIVGMGGMGKTTLARNVYDHLLIQNHFDVRLWATLSQEYSLENILTELLFGERKSTSDENVNGLGLELHKKLWNRRYLIVLDDMWSVGAWDEIQMFLPDNVNGSCVIVTTRLSNLSTHLSSSPFEMDFLDDDKSWQLFCGKTFGEEEDCPAELEEIGKKIVKRCRGLPLSIVVIGGHLRRSSMETEYWEKVSDYMNPIWSSTEDDQCLKIISLSYDYLPACLKPCFLYMGIFEEDEWIEASELVKFWVCEGFAKAKGGVSLEEIAEDYLKDLMDRNLILVHDRRWNGKVEYFVIHDIVRELCLKVAEKEKFMAVVGNTKDIGRERRIVIPRELERHTYTNGALELSPMLLRSLVHQGEWLFDEFSVELGLLRVLYVDNMLLNKDAICFPAPTLHQVNLRYLDFFCTKPITLLQFTKIPYLIPPSISQFWNMQTLTIKVYGVQIILPDEIWEMSQIRHLKFVQFCLPDPIPGNEEECIVLQNLQTLEGVENLRLTEEVCKRMPNIKTMSVSYNHLPGDCGASSYYCPHNLCRLNKLESLKCVFDVDSEWRDMFLSFTFPSSLVELSLLNCNLHWEDLTMMIKSLPHLGYLQLLSVKGSEWNLVDEEFSCLKKLSISCHDLVSWNASSTHFPVLEILDVGFVPKLSEIPFDVGEIPTLRRIQLNHCSVSAAVSAMRIVVEQESFDNQDLQLEVDFQHMGEVEIFQKMLQEEGLTSNSLRLNLPRPLRL